MRNFYPAFVLVVTGDPTLLILAVCADDVALCLLLIALCFIAVITSLSVVLFKLCLLVFPISHRHCVLPLLFPNLCPTQQPIPYTLFVIVTAEHKPGISFTLPHMTCQISCLQQIFGIVKNDWYFLSHCSGMYAMTLS